MLPKIHSFKTFAIYFTGLILAGLALIPLAQMGYNKMIFGESVANTLVYPILNYAISIIATIAIFVIAFLIIWSIASFIRNRGKPIEPSDELKAINQTNKLLKDLIDRIDERWPK